MFGTALIVMINHKIIIKVYQLVASHRISNKPNKGFAKLSSHQTSDFSVVMTPVIRQVTPTTKEQVEKIKIQPGREIKPGNAIQGFQQTTTTYPGGTKSKPTIGWLQSEGSYVFDHRTQHLMHHGCDLQGK